MTVSSSVNKAIFLGSGSAGPFVFSFKFFSNGEIYVFKTDAYGVETLFSEGDDYVLTGAGVDTGGQVVLTTVLAPGESIEILRTLDLLQETAFKNQGAFYSELHEDAFDRIVMILQQLNERITNLETRVLAIETNGYTFTITQVSTPYGIMTEVPTSGGDVIIGLPSSGSFGVMKDGSDANVVTFTTTVPGHTIKEEISLETDGSFVWLTLFGTQWRITG